MSFLVLKKCCICVDLRSGSFIIGYLMLFLRLLLLVVSSIEVASTNSMLHHHSIASQDLAFHRLTGIIGMMILVFETLLCIALVVGLHKRLDQHVEMYYVGTFAFLMMGIVLYAVVLLRYAENFGAWAWVYVAVEICLKLIQLYFLSVIRSYYYKMKEEAKDDAESLASKKTTSNYFARTKPVLISSKP